MCRSVLDAIVVAPILVPTLSFEVEKNTVYYFSVEYLNDAPGTCTSFFFSNCDISFELSYACAMIKLYSGLKEQVSLLVSSRFTIDGAHLVGCDLLEFVLGFRDFLTVPLQMSDCKKFYSYVLNC